MPKEISVTITSKGQITLPAEVRRHLGLRPKDKVAFVIEPEGTVRVRPPRYPDIDSLRGAAGSAGSLDKPLTWPEMRAMAREDRRTRACRALRHIR